MELDIVHMRITIWLTVAMLAAVILFAAFPSIDLKVSALFFMGETGNWLAVGTSFEFWRNVIRRSGEAVAATAFLIFVGNLVLGEQQKTGWRVWAYLWLSMISCAGVLVNGLLKSNLGRARPNGVLEFGGHQMFTPAFQLSNQCSSNCSFSSGEVALVASVVLPLCVLIWPQLSRTGKILIAGLAIAAIVLTAMMRIASGRHFLSDTIMSMLFASLISVFLYRALAIGSHRHVFTAKPIFADVSSILAHASRYVVKTSRIILDRTRWVALRIRVLALREYARFFSQRRSGATVE